MNLNYFLTNPNIILVTHKSVTHKHQGEFLLRVSEKQQVKRISNKFFALASQMSTASWVVQSSSFSFSR